MPIAIFKQDVKAEEQVQGRIEKYRKGQDSAEQSSKGKRSTGQSTIGLYYTIQCSSGQTRALRDRARLDR